MLLLRPCSAIRTATSRPAQPHALRVDRLRAASSTAQQSYPGEGGAQPEVQTAADAAARDPPAAVPLDAIPEAKLKDLRRQGLAMKDVIKMGRRGVAEGLVAQIRQRWNSSEVAKVYCHGKLAADMRARSAELEALTGGVVVHRAGGVVFLYRGQQDPREQQ